MIETAPATKSPTSLALAPVDFLNPPWRGVATLVALQLVLWTLIPALVNKTPPTDVLEGYMWGREWMLVTYKHPQLPAWSLQVIHLLTGSYSWGHFLVSQIYVTATFVLAYLLGRDLMGPRAALAGVLLLPTIAVFSWGTRQFNHDVAQMPFWVAIPWLLWRAERKDSLPWWLALAAVAGLSVYAKFSTGLIILFAALWLFVEPTARRRMARPGPWIAMALFFAILAPLAYQMARMHFIQLTYAVGRDDWVLIHRGRFYYIGVQLALLLLFAIALYASGLLRRRRRVPGDDSRLRPLAPRRERLFLLWMGAGPPALIAAASMFTGIGEAWSKPMYSLLGLIAIAFLGRRLDDKALRRVVGWGLGVTLFGVATYGVYAPAKCYLFGEQTNACLPAPRIARQLRADWNRQVPTPLGIVAGDPNLAMSVGLFAGDRISMFTDFSRRDAPWITPERLKRQGMLIIWNGDGPPPAAWHRWTGDLPVHHRAFRWAANRPKMHVGYVIVPPATASAAPAATSKAITAAPAGAIQ